MLDEIELLSIILEEMTEFSLFYTLEISVFLSHILC